MVDTYRPRAGAAVLSAWQAGTLRPWEAGVYERDGTGGRYSCWDGQRWMRAERTPAMAARQTRPAAETPAVPWRGLAAPSGEHCATCRGHSVIDRGVDPDSQADLIDECPDC